MAPCFQLSGQIPDTADRETRLGREQGLAWPSGAAAPVDMLANPIGQDKARSGDLRIAGNLIQPLKPSLCEVVICHR